ncbi:MAG: hypothetical protein AAF202_04865, partial [Pseudomonadota bacterium]
RWPRLKRERQEEKEEIRKEKTYITLTKEGPAVTTMPPSTETKGYRDRIRNLHADLENYASSRVVDARYNYGGSPLTFQVSISRFATAMMLAELAIEQGVRLNDRSVGALRGAAMFLGFELRRLQESKTFKKSEFVAELMAKAAEHAPQAMAATADGADYRVDRFRVSEQFLRVAPELYRTNSQESSTHAWARRAISAAVSAGIVATYMYFDISNSGVVPVSQLPEALAIDPSSQISIPASEPSSNKMLYVQQLVQFIPHAILGAASYLVTNRLLNPKPLIADRLNYKMVVPSYQEIIAQACRLTLEDDSSSAIE